MFKNVFIPCNLDEVNLLAVEQEQEKKAIGVECEVRRVPWHSVSVSTPVGSTVISILCFHFSVSHCMLCISE